MNHFSRRDFLRVGVSAAGLLLVPRSRFLEAATISTEPHFFLKVVLNTGADTSYMFDARPLALTAAGKMQNYLGEDPVPWTGSNGVSTLTTSLISPLAKFKNQFSILNGVMMDAEFDGHSQNMNYLFAGNPFGGESFIPHLNLLESGYKSDPFDAIQSGALFATLQNTSSIVPLTASSADALSKTLGQLAPVRTGDETMDFIRSRYMSATTQPGRFASGAALMLRGLNGSAEVHQMISQLPPANPNATPDEQFLDLVCNSFKNRLSRSAIWVLPEQFDTHAPDRAAKHPDLVRSAMQKLALVFQKLSDTPFDNARSMLDVTTIMATSEFSRTMRDGQSPINKTGTNHNPLNNTVLLGGRGIKCGQVIGASDFVTTTEKLSDAHVKMDPQFLKLMAKPFDFSHGQTRTDLPKDFDIQDYLTIGSVINTIYSLFGLPNSRYRTFSRNLPKAIPTIPGLLK